MNKDFDEFQDKLGSKTKGERIYDKSCYFASQLHDSVTVTREDRTLDDLKLPPGVVMYGMEIKDGISHFTNTIAYTNSILENWEISKPGRIPIFRKIEDD